MTKLSIEQRGHLWGESDNQSSGKATAKNASKTAASAITSWNIFCLNTYRNISRIITTGKAGTGYFVFQDSVNALDWTPKLSKMEDLPPIFNK